MRCGLFLLMCAVSVRQSVCPSVRYVAQLGFTVLGSFGAAFAISPYNACIMLWYKLIDVTYIGNLNFAHVEAWDANNDTNYVCVVFSPVLRSLVQGGDQRVILHPHSTSQ